jgi:translocation and assembly module TamB
MSEAQPDAPRHFRRAWPRRLAFVVLTLLALAALAVALVPWWLGTAAGTRWLAAQASRALAPATLEIADSDWSWTGPTRFRGFVLRDAQGEAVLDAPEATWDRSLWQAIFGRPALGSFSMRGARLAVDRLPDGHLDLADALAPVLVGGPRSSLEILIEKGTLVARAPELAEPIRARDLDLALRRPPAPHPTEFSVRGVEDVDVPSPATMDLQGTLTRPVTTDAEVLSVRSNLSRWPIALRGSDATELARARLGGTLAAEGRDGAWTTTGTVVSEETVLDVPPFGGRVDLGRVEAAWDLSQNGDIWNAQRLSVRALSARVEAAGPLPPRPGSTTSLNGDADLAVLFSRFPGLAPSSALLLDAGRATWNARVEPSGDSGSRWDANAEVAGLAFRRGETIVRLDAPTRLAFRATQSRDRLSLDELRVEGDFLHAEGRGDVDLGLELSGRLDLGRLRNTLAPLFPDGAPAGEGNAQFTATYRREADRYTGRLDAQLSGVSLALADATPAAPAAAVPPPPPPGLGADPAPPPAPRPPVDAPPIVLTADVAGPADGPGLPAGLDTLTADLSGGGLRGSARVRPAAADRVLIERLELGPAGPPEGPRPAPWLAATGEYADRTLVLRPDTEPTPPLALDADGLRVVGLGTGAWRAEAALRFDIDGEFGPARAVGSARLAVAPTDAGALRLDGRAEAPTLALSGDEADTELGPAHAEWSATLTPASGPWTLALDRLAFESDALGASARGSIADLLGVPALDLQGTLDPRWSRLSAQLAERLGPDALVAGEPGHFRVSGPLDSTTGDLALAITSAQAYGMTLGHAPLRVWWDEGRAGVDPIETTLNGGALRVVPEISTSDDGRRVLRLSEGTTLADAAVNEELSHRVLAYVAPVLDRASRISGFVSAAIREAVIPLEPGARDEVIVEGEIVFQDVVFAPGPLMMQVYRALGAAPRNLRLDQPVQVSIRDGYIHERGFSLPLGDVARVEMAGTVGFDRSLAMTGRVGMAAERFGDVPVFNQVAPALKLDFPIEGTLDDPKVDAEGLARSVGRMGLDSLKGLGLGGLDALVDLVNRPPPTPEELAAREAERERARAERALRQQRQREEQQRKKEERRLRREERRLRRMGG